MTWVEKEAKIRLLRQQQNAIAKRAADKIQ